MILEGGQMEAHVLDCNDDHDHGDDHDDRQDDSCDLRGGKG